MCIRDRVLFYVWEAILTIRQNLYLQRLAEEEEQRIAEEEEQVDVVPDFPMCGLEEAVSVACIDLAYSVQFKQNKVKDEKRDTTSVSFALDETIHQSEDENGDDFNLERSRSIRNSYKTRKDWASNVMRKASKMSLPNVSLPKSGQRDIGLEENDIGYKHRPHRRSSSPEAYIPDGKVTLTQLPVIRKIHHQVLDHQMFMSPIIMRMRIRENTLLDRMLKIPKTTCLNYHWFKRRKGESHMPDCCPVDLKN